MTEKKYTEREEHLLRNIDKADAWYNRVSLTYLIPILFVSSQYFMLYHITDELRTITFSRGFLLRCVILPVGLLMLITAFIVDTMWRQMRIFKQILEKEENHNKALEASGD